MKKYDFPALDLLSDLVALYFKHTNLLAPLFHRPTFDRSVADGLHHQNDGFARVLLLVCAVGAKFSDDPRVLLEGMSDWHSAGHKWYSQVEVSPVWGQGTATLYDLQMHAVSITQYSVWVVARGTCQSDSDGMQGCGRVPLGLPDAGLLDHGRCGA